MAGTSPEAFRTAVTPSRAGYQTLSQEQLTIIDRHLAGHLDLLRAAFEHFGQGDLVDDRRPAGNKVHMMDSSGPADPPIGYHRWHAIIRAMTVLDVDAERWQAIDRLVALAWPSTPRRNRLRTPRTRRSRKPGWRRCARTG